MATEAPPPSYDAVTQSLMEKAKDGTNVAAGVADLSPEELATINNSDPPPAYTDEEKAKIHDEVVKILAKDETLIEVLKDQARKAVQACKKNDEIFNTLLDRLLKVDQENLKDGDDKFVPRLKALREKYRTIIDDSRKLAAKIAVYGINFDEVVVVMCADATLNADKRKASIKDAMDDVDKFEAQSKKIIDDLKGAQDDFNALAVSFSQWAQTQSATIDSDIARVNQELRDLSERLKNLRNLLIGFGVGAAVGIGLVIGGFWAGPFAPLCWAAGALLTLGFGVGLVATGIQFAACKSEIDRKNEELATLTQTKKNIEAARAGLVTAADVDAKEFAANIASITAVWVAAKGDTVAIHEWLDKGAKIADTPQYMKTQLEHGLALYSKMSQYLSEYAMGLEVAGIPKPAST